MRILYVKCIFLVGFFIFMCTGLVGKAEKEIDVSSHAVPLTFTNYAANNIALHHVICIKPPIKITRFTSPKNFFSSTLESPVNDTSYYTAVFERIENGVQAILLLEELHQEIILPVNCLPEHTRVHTWFDVLIKDNKYIALTRNVAKTTAEIEKSKAILNQLQEK